MLAYYLRPGHYFRIHGIQHCIHLDQLLLLHNQATYGIQSGANSIIASLHPLHWHRFVGPIAQAVMESRLDSSMMVAH